MDKFKIGQRVIIVDLNCDYVGCTGIITEKKIDIYIVKLNRLNILIWLNKDSLRQDYTK